MLSLIGLGLSDEKDLTLRGVELVKSADSVYVETYTSNWQGSLENLEKIIGRKISVLSRKDLEENSKKILDEAKNKNVVVFVGGDPLVATTHVTLLTDAKKFGTETRIVHNASIFSAIAETGLHIYRFGATVTVPFLEKTKGELPESVYNTIDQNKKMGLHTLCLLDLADGKCMTPKEAAKILLELENKFKKKIFEDKTKVVVYSQSNGSSKINFSEISAVSGENTPAVLVIPADLHFTEKEFLEAYSKA